MELSFSFEQGLEIEPEEGVDGDGGKSGQEEKGVISGTGKGVKKKKRKEKKYRAEHSECGTSISKGQSSPIPPVCMEHLKAVWRVGL